MTKDLARKLAIAVLDDEHGISEAAFYLLQEACECGPLEHESYCGDIFRAVSAQDGRFFLNEDTKRTI